MTKPYLPFIDWMKCLGLLLIIVGHVSALTDHLLPPIYPKQLGVAFFLFVSGYSLARETRPGREAVFHRLFEIYLYGIACALLLSAFHYARSGRLALSNYLPFFLGANALFDNFPANPTTWFIGTYLHFILLWVLVLRGVRIRPGMLGLSIVVEVLARAALAGTAGPFIAYMAVPNWITVFLLGLYHGQRPEEAPATGLARPLIWMGVLTPAWAPLAGTLVADSSFPFMRLAVGSRASGLVIMSVLVSFLYLAYTTLIYQVTRRLRAPAAVRFVARNTLLVFIAHMPVYYALRGPLARWTDSYGLRVAIQFGACFLALAVLSEALGAVIRPRALRERLGRILFGAGPPPEDPAGGQGRAAAAAGASSPASGSRQ